MQILTHSLFLKALGWALLHSLWQFGLLWLIFLIFLHYTKKQSASLKHAIALLLITAGSAWFMAGFSLQYFTDPESIDRVSSVYHLQGKAYYTGIYRSVTAFLENNLSFFSIIYLVIVTGFFTRFLRFFRYSNTLQTRGLNKMKPELRVYVEKLVEQLDIKRNVKVWVSEYIDTPMVMGFIKPVILIPLACINQLSTTQLEAVLLHELAHIKRNDYLVNLYIAIVEMLFFFNPFAALLVRSVKQEREKSCDDWVLQFRFDPYQYAAALLSLEKSRSSAYSLAIAAAGANKNLLLQRIERIMGIRSNRPESPFKLAAYCLIVGALVFFALTKPGNEKAKSFKTQFTVTEPLRIGVTSSVASISKINGNASIKPYKNVQNRKHAGTKIYTDTGFEKPYPVEDALAFSVFNDAKEKDEIPRLALLESSINENQDFSIKEKYHELPEAAATDEFPFVPNSSYSFYSTEDTNAIKKKMEKHYDHGINQSLAHARKALATIDWNKIGRNQKLSKTAISNLQKELRQSLDNLNWSKIYKETSDSITKEATANMRASLKEELDRTTNFKLLEQQYETIKLQLQQQQEKYRTGVEKEIREIEKEIKKKKVIVYI